MAPPRPAPPRPPRCLILLLLAVDGPALMGAGLPSRVVERRVDCASVFRGLARSADCDRPASLFVYFWKRKAVADLPAPANHMLKRVRYTPSEEQMTRRGK